jgi:hypothetical protein
LLVTQISKEGCKDLNRALETLSGKRPHWKCCWKTCFPAACKEAFVLEILPAACQKEISAGNCKLQLARKNLGQKFFMQLARNLCL